MTQPMQMTWLTLVAGPDTRPEDTWLAGRIIGVPTGTDIGSGPTNPGIIQGVRGYPRPAQAPNPPTPLEWVLSSTLPAAAKAFIHNLPDSGWANPVYENAYLTMASALVERGIGLEDVGLLIETLHDNAVENERANTDPPTEG